MLQINLFYFSSYSFNGIIICLNSDSSFFLSGSISGVIKIGASGFSNCIEICVVSITHNTSKKYTEFIQICAFSPSTTQINLTSHSHI